MDFRLTSSNFVGISRNEVAVGTSRLASILETIRAAAPRSGVPSGCAGADVVGAVEGGVALGDVPLAAVVATGVGVAASDPFEMVVAGDVAPEPGEYPAKNSRQLSLTDEGSERN